MRAARGGQTILGTSIVGNREVERCEKVHQLLVAAQRRVAAGPPALVRRSVAVAAVLVPAAAPQATVLAARRLVPPHVGPSQSAGHQPPGGEFRSVVVRLALPPLSLLVPVGRCGVETWPGLQVCCSCRHHERRRRVAVAAPRCCNVDHCCVCVG